MEDAFCFAASCREMETKKAEFKSACTQGGPTTEMRATEIRNNVMIIRVIDKIKIKIRGSFMQYACCLIKVKAFFFSTTPSSIIS